MKHYLTIRPFLFFFFSLLLSSVRFPGQEQRRSDKGKHTSSYLAALSIGYRSLNFFLPAFLVFHVVNVAAFPSLLQQKKIISLSRRLSDIGCCKNSATKLIRERCQSREISIIASCVLFVLSYLYKLFDIDITTI